MEEDTVGPAGPDASGYALQIGMRIRSFREARGLSLSELSRRSGVAKGTLSALESGQGNPTVMTLVFLGRALGLTPSDFLDTGGGNDGEASALRTGLSGPHIAMRLLSRHESEDEVWEIYEATLPNGAAPFRSRTHDGIEHIFMLTGEATIGPEEAPFHLAKGQSCAFAGKRPHLYHAPAGPATMLMIMQYPAAGRHQTTSHPPSTFSV